MERLEAADRESGVKETSLSGVQKEAIAEARRVAASRLAERVDPGDAMERGSPIRLSATRPRTSTGSTGSELKNDRDRAIESIRGGRR